MKTLAVYLPKPGKAEIREIEVGDPGPDEVQVRCLANGICMYEVSVFRGIEPCPQGPVGHEGIGVVAKAGGNVTNVKEGDFVPCGGWVGIQNLRAASLPVFRVPISDPTLFVMEPVECVVRALRAYDITPGDRALLLNVQGLARNPLSELVVTDVVPGRLALAREFGATETVQTGTPAGDKRLQDLRASPFDLVIECAGVESTIQEAGYLTRNGGRLAIFAWHHGMRSVNMTRWHMGGLKVLNTAPSISIDHNVNTRERTLRLMERGVFDLRKLVTHRFPVEEVQKAMELAAERRSDFIKGVLTFGQ
jgi:threonine dehydrogenase-like Zn-dependent dehydrogenase